MKSRFYSRALPLSPHFHIIWPRGLPHTGMAAHGFDGSEAGSGEWFIVWRRPEMMGGPSFLHPWLLHAVEVGLPGGLLCWPSFIFDATIGTGFGVH